MIELKEVTHGFRGHEPVLRRVNLTLSAGDRTVVLGENGCGKTTLLRLVCGLAEPDQGSVTKDPGLELSYLPQTLDFPDHLRIDRILSFYENSRSTTEDRDELVHLLDLDRFRDQSWSTLSGGEQRRVSLALTLGKRADVYVLDEPFAGLSPDLVEERRETFLDRGDALLMTSHLRESVSGFSGLNPIRMRDGSLEPESGPEGIPNATV